MKGCSFAPEGFSLTPTALYPAGTWNGLASGSAGVCVVGCIVVIGDHNAAPSKILLRECLKMLIQQGANVQPAAGEIAD